MILPAQASWQTPPLARLLRPVHLIGYWASEWEPHWPSPQTFVDAKWNQREQQAVIAHLETAALLAEYGGSSWCRFNCGQSHLGHREFTDGYFYWPEGLSHYVRIHHVRPPALFVDHVLHRSMASYWLRRVLDAALDRWGDVAPFCSEAWWRSLGAATITASGSIEAETAS